MLRRISTRLGVAVTAIAVSLAPVVVPSPAFGFDIPHERLVSDNPADWTPRVVDTQGSVRYLEQVGDTLVAGGNFTKVAEAGSNTALNRQNAFAFDATTGKIHPGFAPALDGMVMALVVSPDGKSVFLGGDFKTVNGVQRISLAKVSLDTGQLDPTFNAPRLNGRVWTLKLAKGKLFVGGSFTRVGVNVISGIAAFDPVTGAVDQSVNVPFEGVHNGGVTIVLKMDISPDERRLAAIGNFTHVGGLPRPQAALLDISGPVARVDEGWRTNRYAAQCGPQYNSYMHDVQFSPDGSYFVIGTTGKHDASSLCLTTARWESNATGADLQPTWVNMTGGDTVWSMAVTGAVVYVGGHFRWQNNPFGSDKQGPGGVPRPGIAALDPRTGVPFDWNPGRETGVGVFDLYATEAGLWVGHDTNIIGKESHPKLAFFPLAGGKAIPSPSRGSLPGNVLQLGQAKTSNTQVLHRVNAGGPAVLATDGGPIWGADRDFNPSNLHNSGNTAQASGAVGGIDRSVPSTTPNAVFTDERMDPVAAPEMAWRFPAAAGTPVEVRLYFRDANSTFIGQRIFDIAVENQTVLEKYDIVASVGQNVGAMRNFFTTAGADGDIDVSFVHRVGNPVLSAVEVVRSCGSRASTTTNDRATSRAFDGTTVGPATNVASSGTAWSQARGAFMISGKLYTGFSDGSLCVRDFDGTTFGPPTPIDTYQNLLVRSGRDIGAGDLANMTAMFFDNNRIYYTVANKTQLFYKHFTPQSNILSAQSFSASPWMAGFDTTRVGGMFLSADPAGSDKTFLYYTTSDTGQLRRIQWNGTAPVPFTDSTVSGPAIDGVTWKQQGLALVVPTGATG